jgi:hypothetical protein
VGTDADVSAEYFEELARLSRELREQRIAIYSHGYDYLAFGSWMIEAGTRHRRVQVTYDGKEGLLRSREAVVPSNNAIREWEDREESRVAAPRAAFVRAADVIIRYCGYSRGSVR